MLTPQNIQKHKLIQLLGDYTTLMILAELELYKTLSFNTLKTKIAINPSTLTKKLRILENEGFIAHDTDAHGVKHNYTFTAKGKLLVPVIDVITKVSQKIAS
jgi:DNA-binding HxlR family transcriptional regulator